jgi:hypothetical protein
LLVSTCFDRGEGEALNEVNYVMFARRTINIDEYLG